MSDIHDEKVEAMRMALSINEMEAIIKSRAMKFDALLIKAKSSSFDNWPSHDLRRAYQALGVALETLICTVEIANS